ncbi:excisionase family DNA-binding protein [Janibacter indicus]|uniref:excisionase family DNA-binding protein n=1 Tax=Janibacter indicus TaxID=857417 RepID=UPI003D9A86D3
MPRNQPSPDVPARRWVSLDDAAAYVSVSPLTIRRRIADGSLTGYRLGRSRTIRIDLDELDEMLRPIPVGGGVGA